MELPDLVFALSLPLLAPFGSPFPLGSKTLPAQDKVSQLVAQLGNNKDSNLSYQAFRKLLQDKPKKALPLLVKLLPQFSVYGRSLAFSLIQSYPRDLSQKTLRKLLKSDPPPVAMAAGIALYRLGDKSVAPSINKLLLASPPGKTREDLLRRLSSLRDRSVQQTVRGFLVPSASLGELDASLYNLSLSQDPFAAKAARDLLGSSKLSEPKRSLLEAFLLSQDQVCDSTALTKELEKTGDFYRLQKFLTQAEKLPRPVLQAIARYLEAHPSQYQSRYAIEILAKNSYRKALPSIRKLVNSKQPLVSQAAFDALQKLGGLSDKASFYQFLKSKDPSLALGAAETLRRMDDASGLPRVLEILQSQSPKALGLRYKAIQVLGDFRHPSAVPLLLRLLLDPNASNRSQATYALSKTLRCLFPYKRIDLASAGYRSTGPAQARAKAVAQLQKWWKRVAPNK